MSRRPGPRRPRPPGCAGRGPTRTRPRAARLSPGLDREDLVQAAPMAGLAAERRAEEGDDALPRRLRADDPRPEREDVHVIVLDALVGGVRVMADGGSHAADLVGRDARAD